MIIKAHVARNDQVPRALCTLQRGSAVPLTLELENRTTVDIVVQVSATDQTEDLVRIEGTTQYLGERANIIAQVFINGRSPSGYAEVTLLS